MARFHLPVLVVSLILLATTPVAADRPRIDGAIGVSWGYDHPNPKITDLIARGLLLEGGVVPDPRLRLRLRLALGSIDGPEVDGTFIEAGVGLDLRRCSPRACGGIGAELGESHYAYDIDLSHPRFLATTAAISLFGEIVDPVGFVFGYRLACRGRRTHGDDGRERRHQLGVFADLYVGFSF